MKLRMITVAVLLGLMGMLFAPAQISAKPKPKNPVAIPVSGGTFTGQFRLERVELNGTGGVTLIGDLLGADGRVVPNYENMAWPVDMAATQAANSAAAPAGFAALATCDILELVLAPLSLNLLGLQVDLSRVVLTITGQTGQLLGDLLCGLLGGLDIGSLLASLNTLLGNLGGALGSLTGALALVGGLFLLSNFTNTAGQILANGTIAGLPASGPVDLAATQGTCDILHLVLGPLHLNLLGLVVDLNRVTLDITAQQGGGLLGDLLCSVANLLNGGGLSNALRGLTQLLNNILAILGTA